MFEAQSECAHRPSVALLAIVLVGVAHGPAFRALGTEVESPCTSAGTILPDDLHHGFAGRGESLCYRIDLDSPGALMVAVAAPTAAPTEPKLRLRDELGTEPRGVVVVARTATQWILRILEPGAYFFDVGPQDPRWELGEHTFASRFVRDAEAVEVTLDEVSPPSGPTKTGEDGEIGPILVTSPPSDPEAGEDGEIGPILVVSPSSDPDKGGEDGEIGPILVTTPPSDGSGSSTTLVDCLCRQESADDDPDRFFACSRALRSGKRLVGELVNTWAEDLDIFHFVLTEQRTVELEVHGDVEVVGALYDRRHHRLAVVDDGSGSRLVRTLAPGLYFFRIEGRAGAEGSYSLTLATTPW